MKMALVLVALLVGLTAPAQDFAYRIPCEVQTAGEQSLGDLEWMQGTTPLIQLDILQRGKPVNADTGTVVRFILGPSATGTYYAAVTGTLHSATNVTASGTNVLLSYRVQLPTIGTNSAGAAWWSALACARRSARSRRARTSRAGSRRATSR